MRKLKLHLDDLTVHTFEPQAPTAAGGTIRALESEDGRLAPTQFCGLSVNYSCVDRSCAPACDTGYPDTCWVSWDPAARCAIPH